MLRAQPLEDMAKLGEHPGGWPSGSHSQVTEGSPQGWHSLQLLKEWTEHMPLPSIGQSPTGASHGQDLARSQVAKEPECGLQSPSLGIVEQRLPWLSSLSFLPMLVFALSFIHLFL